MSNELRDHAREVLTAEGFAVDIDDAGKAEIAAAVKLSATAISNATSSPNSPRDSGSPSDAANIRDLRSLPWSSIDNVTTRDVDQIEQSEITADGTLIRIAIADVDAFLPRDGSLDKRAAQNTTSVYGGDVLLSMLPKELSEGVTSLLANEDRLAIVAEFVVSKDGDVKKPAVYRALVRNKAQLDYRSVSAWLAGTGPLPPAAKGLEEQLRMQLDAAIRLHGERDRLGALEFERRETTPVMRDGVAVDIEMTDRGPARDLIEDFMIAANSVIAGFLEADNVSWIRRMVGAPERWGKIVQIAAHNGVTLPAAPDRRALGSFLRDQRTKNPSKFAALSLSVLRLLGSGSYVVEHRAEDLEAHFALGVQDYTHFTAPNRRYADVVTQRIVKAVLAKQPLPYDDHQLEAIAAQCTTMEDKANGVERKIAKLAAVEVMSKRIGQVFDATITAAAGHNNNTAVIKSPAVEVHVEAEQLTPGEHVRVRVTGVDTEKSVVEGAVVP